MKEIVSGQYIVDWVGKQVDEDQFHNAKGIGLLHNGEILAGVVYNLYNGVNICMHVAASSPRRWMTKEYLYECFAYPFIQLECNRVTGLVRVDNEMSKHFCLRLGFKPEGLIRRACVDGTDMVMFGMLREECRWLEIKK